METGWSLLRSRLKTALGQLPNLPRTLRLVRNAAGSWTTAWVVLLLLQAGIPVGIVLLSRHLVDGIVDHSRSPGPSTPGVISAALAMVSLLLFGEIIKALMQWVRNTQAELVGDHIRLLIQEHAAKLDMAFYDSPEYFDTLHRARFDAQSRPIALVESLGGFLQGILTLISMAIVLFGYAWWLPFALLLSTIPALFVVLRYILRHHQWRIRRTQDRRKTLYYEILQTSRESLPEIRLYALAPHFRQRFEELRKQIRGEYLSLSRSEAIARIFAGLSGLGIGALSLLWMLRDLLRGLLSFGELAMYGQAFFQGQKLTRGTLEQIGQIYSNLIFLGNLFEFLELKPLIVNSENALAPRDNPSPSLRFSSVSFRYPTAEKPTLEDFNLLIPAGKVTAILGRNGAGKSTLFKLMLRLYDPHQGSIEIDGIDIRNLDIPAYRKKFAILFQRPLQFSASLGENIRFGNLSRSLSPDGLRFALDSADAGRIAEGLPDGIETMLGPWFGGTELSVGEWQRIALSRAFFRQADIMLLDEPTSAMDSWAEKHWIDSFLERAAGKTVVIITHRLHTARAADIIHVMTPEGIIESGNHEDLLRAGGRYAEAWRSDIEEG